MQSHLACTINVSACACLVDLTIDALIQDHGGLMNDGISVYIADDHTMLREGLAALVVREGDIHIVGQTGDGLTVLPEVSRLMPDVAVVDIGMPGLNGLDICRDLTKKVHQTSVLILTMESDEEFIIAALNNGASGYLTKDAASQQLSEAIRAVARGEVYLAPGISPRVLTRLGNNGDDPYTTLTSRERQVLHMIAEGKTNPQTADALGLKTKTVDTHRTRLMKKLDIHDQTSLVKFAIRRGIIRVNSPRASRQPPQAR